MCCSSARPASARATSRKRSGTAPAARATRCSPSARTTRSVSSARRERRQHDRKLLRLTTSDLLILDDLGLRALSGDEPGDLYEIIRHRYEHGALVVTSNRDVDQISRLFGDPLLASAAMDRLLHHAEIIRIEGDSYRNPPTNRRTRAARPADKEAAR